MMCSGRFLAAGCLELPRTYPEAPLRLENEPMAQRIEDPNDEHALLWLAFAQSIADCYAVMRALGRRRSGAQLPGPAVRQPAAGDADLLASSCLRVAMVPPRPPPGRRPPSPTHREVTVALVGGRRFREQCLARFLEMSGIRIVIGAVETLGESLASQEGRSISSSSIREITPAATEA
jgi:hypothetical protein